MKQWFSDIGQQVAQDSDPREEEANGRTLPVPQVVGCSEEKLGPKDL